MARGSRGESHSSDGRGPGWKTRRTETLHGERAAVTFLDEQWYPTAGDADIPVNVHSIARAVGIDVFPELLEPNVAGALKKRPGRDPHMIVNKYDSRQRQRFTVAHELGHWYLRSISATDAYEFIDERADLSARGENGTEIFCNSFGACLLMPEEAVKHEHARGETLFGMARRFDVSAEAMANRLKNLRLDPRDGRF